MNTEFKEYIEKPKELKRVIAVQITKHNVDKFKKSIDSSRLPYWDNAFRLMEDGKYFRFNDPEIIYHSYALGSYYIIGPGFHNGNCIMSERKFKAEYEEIK